VGRKQ